MALAVSLDFSSQVFVVRQLGNRQDAADRLDSVELPVIVDEVDITSRADRAPPEQNMQNPAQDLIVLLRLAVLTFQHLDPFALGGVLTFPVIRVALDLPAPAQKGFRRAAYIRAASRSKLSAKKAAHKGRIKNQNRCWRPRTLFANPTWRH